MIDHHLLLIVGRGLRLRKKPVRKGMLYDSGVMDNLSWEDRRRTMRAVKSKRTGPERRLRAMLAARGFRGWRANPPGIAGKPDFAFPAECVALFIDGCFWHSCP